MPVGSLRRHGRNRAHPRRGNAADVPPLNALRTIFVIKRTFGAPIA
jgi:hypothetical protein